MLNEILLKFKRKTKNNKGFIPLYVALMVTFFFVPSLAVVYDLANMRIYKTDITNIAQMAVLSCVAHEGNTFHMDSCRTTIKNVIAINLFNTVVDPSDENQSNRAGGAQEKGGNWQHPLPNEIFEDYFKRPYNASTLQTTMENVIINPLANNRGFYVSTFTSYKPIFLRFGKWGESGIEIVSNPVVVSASYICQHGGCEQLDQAYRQQREAEKEAERQMNEEMLKRQRREHVW